MLLCQRRKTLPNRFQAIIVNLGGNDLLGAIRVLDGTLYVHLSHGATCAYEYGCATRMQFTTIAGFTIRGSDIWTLVAHEGDVVIVQSTDIGINHTIQSGLPYQVQGTSAGDVAGDLADSCSGARDRERRHRQNPDHW